ncbi:MAG: hypothetical protein HY207_08440 [Nitrospirae bacterium]|nr:hypothetical protein [Nitrospirota bacterium]
MTPLPGGLYQQLITVSEFFETRRVAYMVIGGIAVGLWAAPRATVDLDFIVGVDEAGLPSLVDAAKQANFVVFDDRPMKFKRITLFRMLLKQEHGDFLTIDCLLSDDDYKRQALARAATLQWEGRTIQVTTPEDLILLKLLSARDHDLVDAKTIVEYRRTSLDHSYLIAWADRLRVDIALRDILAAAT